ncbi:MAG: hypothetical protein ACPGJV_16150 [Bacteriovoracaceae bacterium]
MLQQTTVKTVLGHYEVFLKKFPKLSDLAKATETDIRIAWKGLGYYRRARNLHRAVQEVQGVYSGKFPNDFLTLKSIPGIGDYTASAILGIGRNQSHLAIDANVLRVLERLFDLRLEGSLLKKHKTLQELFASGKIVSKNFSEFQKFNEALMDLGRTYCKARIVRCESCPMMKKCKAFKNKKVESYLVAQKKKVNKSYLLKLLRVLYIKNQKIALIQKNEKEWLSGQYELPTFSLESEDLNLKQYPEIKAADKKTDELFTLKSAITKYKIENQVASFKGSFKALKALEPRIELIPLENQEMSSLTEKILKEFQKEKK